MTNLARHLIAEFSKLVISLPARFSSTLCADVHVLAARAARERIRESIEVAGLSSVDSNHPVGDGCILVGVVGFAKAVSAN